MKPYYQDDRSGITIYNGDCREILPQLRHPFCLRCAEVLDDPTIVIMHDKAGHEIQLPPDLVLTDPPYGVGENAHRIASRTKAAATTDYGEFNWDKEPASDEEITLTMNAAKYCIIWGGNYFKVPPSRGWLVWDKQNSGNFADCELAWTNLKTSVRIFRFLWNGMIRAGEWRDKPRVHPTQKPTELMSWCLSFAPHSETVLDPFMGSGTTLVAAKKRGCKAIGIDIEERYCEIAAKRLSQEVFDFTPQEVK